MMIKLIKVGNGNSDYPGNFTRKEKNIILKNLIFPSLHLFSGKSTIGTVKIDYKYGNHKIDVFYYLKNFTKYGNFKTVIIDAPYNKKFADKYKKLGNTPKQFIIFAQAKKTTELFNYVKDISPDIIILKSWNYYCLAGYNIKECYVCYPGGYRKSTFLIVMEKKQTFIKGVTI